MAETRRRQLHSCDPCRKGKRGCDAPKDRQTGFGSCSNCKRWGKECTFNWISSKRGAPKGNPRRSRASTGRAPAVASADDPVAEMLCSTQWEGSRFGNLSGSPETLYYAPSFSSHSDSVESLPVRSVLNGQYHSPGLMNIPLNLRTTSIPQEYPESVESDTQGELPDLSPILVDGMYSSFQSPENIPESLMIPSIPMRNQSRQTSSDSEYEQRSSPESQWRFCIASENTAAQNARAAMSRNLIRIYHDSMENALSCWLTEHNCPYSESSGAIIPEKRMKEWGPSWSNRMCMRVCQLDRVSASIRGRVLSAEEDKKAARALHLAIMSFASQWTQHAQTGAGASVPVDIDRDERSIREKVWNEARHALELSSSIPSFRIAFANIIFSLTQCPLDKGQEASLGHLLENDRAPMFLETANRQLFTFRHRFARLQREAVANTKDLCGGTIQSTTSNVQPVSQPPKPQLDPILTSQEHRTTLGLMFWLGVMFDTLSAAMYQRPLVVSDEDSQIASVSASASINETDEQSHHQHRNNIGSKSAVKQDVWGDHFLLSAIERQISHQAQPRWPCSYQEAASILSEATPVKVLLYRRITQLQTLIYRGASSNYLENVIQKTLLVYQHWDSTYRDFMLDCVTNHDHLPSRIQSWYVILDGHWHLAAMLLADVLESIDKCRLGCDAARETRQSTHLVATLRTNNALAVAGLARASIQGQDSFMHRHFHDSLSEVAFLVEPWTAVLVHAFAKAGEILLDDLNMSVDKNLYAESLRQNCEFAIRALQYLGRKSDMAFLAARNLSRSLHAKLACGPVVIMT